MSNGMQTSRWLSIAGWCATWLVLLGACFVVAGQAPPHVNEAHYLSKARHYYDPQFGAGDLFLESEDAHTLFFATFGRLTTLFELPTAAWIGRGIIWGAISAALLFLCRSLGLRAVTSLVAGLGVLAFQVVGPMAGEWIVGGVEGKGPAFVLALVAVGFVIRGRSDLALAVAGLAAAWHVLVGGWLMVLIAASVLCERGGLVFREWRYYVAAAFSLVAAAVGLVPALELSLDAPAEAREQAAQIYVYQRLAHHLIFQRFPTVAIVRHFVGWGVFAAAWLRWRDDPIVRRMGLLVWGAGLLMLVGIVLSLLGEWYPATAAKLVRYYWFRTSDWLMPVGLVLVLVRAWQESLVSSGRRVWKGVAVAALIFAATFRSAWIDLPARRYPPASRQAGLYAETSRDQWSEVDAEWQAACDWARTHSPPGATWITPRHQQTFKWYAHRAEVVNWKDVPQDAGGIILWWKRYQMLYPKEVLLHGLTAYGPRRLRTLAGEFDAEWLLIDRRWSGRLLPWKQAYPERITGETRFVIYRIPPIDGPPHD